MAGIEDAIEQDALASSLLSPREQAAEYADRHPEFQHLQQQEGDYAEADQEGAEQAQEAPDGAEDPNQASDELVATPEALEAYQKEMAAWEALPEVQQAQVADQYLEQAYVEAYETITPQQATNFANEFGQTHWGIDNLSERIEPQAFAAFAESWSDNAERTIALHPNGPAFMEALSGGDPQQALELAQSMTDKAMAGRFYNHFRNLLGDDLVQGYTPQTFAAKCLCDLARLGLDSQRQSAHQPQLERQRHDSPFQTNADLFDSEAMEEIARRGLL